MASVLHVHVELVVLDEGMWCRACFLPSGVRAWYVVATGPRMVLRSKLECRDCGGTDIDDGGA